MSILAGEKDHQKDYAIENGEAEILHFSPRLGTLEFTVLSLKCEYQARSIEGFGFLFITQRTLCLLCVLCG
jgi:hypothetical protein